MTEKELLENISKKLNTLIACLLIPTEKKPSVNEGVQLLLRFGLSNSEIAEILGTTKRTVEVVKSKIISMK